MMTGCCLKNSNGSTDWLNKRCKQILKQKKKDYKPYPGFYDLRIFDLNPREFFAAWRVQDFLHRAAGCKGYYKTYAPRQWEEIKELGALLQMFLLPRLKPNEELR